MTEGRALAGSGCRGQRRRLMLAIRVAAAVVLGVVLAAAAVSRLALPVAVERERLATQLGLAQEDVQLSQAGWALAWGPWRAWNVRWAPGIYGELWTDGTRLSSLSLGGRGAHLVLPDPGALHLRDTELLIASVTPARGGATSLSTAEARRLAVGALGALMGAVVVTSDGRVVPRPQLQWRTGDEAAATTANWYNLECDLVEPPKALPRRVALGVSASGEVGALRVLRW